jgi:hypothetical protein
MIRPCLRLWLVLLLALVAGPVLAASGPYVVDDSEINEPGTCKVEAWASRSDTSDHLGVVSPACTFAALPFIELGFTVARGRASGAYDTIVGPKLKLELLPIERFGVGVGFMAGAVHGTRVDSNDAAIAFMPFTVAPVETLRLSLNLGWSWDRSTHRHHSFSGLGGEWQVHPRLAVIAETYGLERGRWGKQIGLRPTLIEDLLDLDLVYGRDIDGNRSNWFSFGGILRF